ncbi:MAG: hypothetical protein ABIK28_12000 [Planctomycetota bacterium]
MAAFDGHGLRAYQRIAAAGEVDKEETRTVPAVAVAARRLFPETTRLLFHPDLGGILAAAVDAD